MAYKAETLTKSLNLFHAACSPCNNCDIEILDVFTPRFDVERLGMTFVGSVRHADVLLVTGIVNKKVVHRIKRLYEQAAKPCLVVAIGGCACSEIIFHDSYNACGPLDKIIPVDIYVPGCTPKPEAIIGGMVKLINLVKSREREGKK